LAFDPTSETPDDARDEETVMTDTEEHRGDTRWVRLKMRGQAWWEAVQPGAQVRTGVAWGMAALVLVNAALLASALKIGINPVADFVLAFLCVLGVAAACALAAAIAAKLIRPVVGLFSWWGFLLLSGAIGTVMVVEAMMLPLIVPFFLLLLVAGAVGGAGLRGGFGDSSRTKKAVIAVAGVTVCVFSVILVYGMASRGTDDHLVEYRPDPAQVEPLRAEDPSQPGPYSVATLTYGSGTDRRRPEYGDDVDLKTGSVDASKLVKGSEGWRMKLRHRYWGFDFESFPVNGRVWYPEGDGPFPLVLCVHGNHSMEEYSDPGYAYLGELLASRGFIFSSVDENFFNGSWRGSLSSENDGRGWMLLQHLKAWREWNRTSDNVFAGRVAMDRIALIGHSRGGEAAAIAGAFNRLSNYPDDATLEFDFDFGIRAIVAIAPSDGQYDPADRPTPLDDLSYLVLQGAHDSDVAVFMGIRQYRRVAFTGDSYRFKTSVYSYRSNHGQFNTAWGDSDMPFPASPVLNRRPLLEGEIQRRLASVYISGFLETTLNHRHEYVRMFRDHRSAQSLLPEDFIITRFQDTTFRTLADFEEDVDVTTGGFTGVRLEGRNLAVWREEHQSYRKYGSKRNGVAVLGWRTPDDEENTGEILPGRYAVNLPSEAADVLQITGDSLLVFSIADTGQKPPPPEENDDDDERQDEDADEDNDRGDDEENNEDKVALDLSLELTTADGVRSTIVLSEVRSIPIPLESKLTKLPIEDMIIGPGWEPTLQTFEVPMSVFVKAAPGFDVGALASIAFVFDQSDEGVIFLDDIGFAEPAPAPEGAELAHSSFGPPPSRPRR
jgi:dienelactone hydrolase